MTPSALLTHQDGSLRDRRDPLPCVRCQELCHRPRNGDQPVCWDCVRELRPAHPEVGKYHPGFSWLEPSLRAERGGRALLWWAGAEVDPGAFSAR